MMGLLRPGTTPIQPVEHIPGKTVPFFIIGLADHTNIRATVIVSR